MLQNEKSVADNVSMELLLMTQRSERCNVKDSISGINAAIREKLNNRNERSM